MPATRSVASHRCVLARRASGGHGFPWRAAGLFFVVLLRLTMQDGLAPGDQRRYAVPWTPRSRAAGAATCGPALVLAPTPSRRTPPEPRSAAYVNAAAARQRTHHLGRHDRALRHRVLWHRELWKTCSVGQHPPIPTALRATRLSPERLPGTRTHPAGRVTCVPTPICSRTSGDPTSPAARPPTCVTISIGS